MEIGNQSIHCLKSVARIDENIRPAGLFAESAILIGKGFECAAGRGANGDHPAAGGAPFVDGPCSLFRDGKMAKLVIRDYGEGISEEDLPYVKVKFYKGKSRAHGNGIGLAVSDEIISLHGGTLDIESKLGEGTTITISLPVKEAETKE